MNRNNYFIIFIIIFKSIFSMEQKNEQKKKFDYSKESMLGYGITHYTIIQEDHKIKEDSDKIRQENHKCIRILGIGLFSSGAIGLQMWPNLQNKFPQLLSKYKNHKQGDLIFQGCLIMALKNPCYENNKYTTVEYLLKTNNIHKLLSDIGWNYSIFNKAKESFKKLNDLLGYACVHNKYAVAAPDLHQLTESSLDELFENNPECLRYTKNIYKKIVPEIISNESSSFILSSLDVDVSQRLLGIAQLLLMKSLQVLKIETDNKFVMYGDDAVVINNPDEYRKKNESFLKDRKKNEIYNSLVEYVLFYEKFGALYISKNKDQIKYDKDKIEGNNEQSLEESCMTQGYIFMFTPFSLKLVDILNNK